MYHIPTSHNQNSFVPLRRKFSTDFEMEGSGLVLINAQLHDWNVGGGIGVTQNGPGAVIETPRILQRNRQWRKHLMYASG